MKTTTILHVLAVFYLLASQSEARVLRGVARATAVSTGGQATAASKSAGGSDVTTAALAVHGGTATATLAADDGGQHTLATVGDGNSTFTVQKHIAVVNWEDAPACISAPKDTIAKDQSGRLWGFENGRSCAFKPVASPLPDSGADSYWYSAPPCPFPQVPGHNVKYDTVGHPWGWNVQTNKSCAFRGARKLLSTAAAVSFSTGGTATTLSTASGGSDVTTQAISQGRDATAVLSASDGSKVSQTTVSTGAATVTFTTNSSSPSWEDAVPCREQPTPSTSKRDDSGRLWGWENNSSCAFKAVNNIEGSDKTWLSAPDCGFESTDANTVKDNEGHPWGWISEKNMSCAFRGAPRSLLAEAMSMAQAQATGDSSAAIAQAAAQSTSGEAISQAAAEAVGSNATTTAQAAAMSSGSAAEAQAQAQALADASGGASQAAAEAVAESVTLAPAKCQNAGCSNPTSEKCQNGGCNGNTSSPLGGAASGSPAPLPVAVPIPASPAPSPVPTVSPSPAPVPVPVATPSASAVPTQVPVPASSSPMFVPDSTGQATSTPTVTDVPAQVPCSPVMTADSTTGQASSASTVTFDSAPSCSKRPSDSEVTYDASGHLWGYENGASCVYRQDSTTGTTAGAVTWETAPACASKPQGATASTDAAGRTWGFENGKSCACKDSCSVAPPTAPSQSGSASSVQTAVPVAWEDAPACQRTKPEEGVKDGSGRAWGFEDDKSCACKDTTGHAAATSEATAIAQSVSTPAHQDHPATTITVSPSPSPTPAPASPQPQQDGNAAGTPSSLPPASSPSPAVIGAVSPSPVPSGSVASASPAPANQQPQPAQSTAEAVATAQAITEQPASNACPDCIGASTTPFIEALAQAQSVAQAQTSNQSAVAQAAAQASGDDAEAVAQAVAQAVAKSADNSAAIAQAAAQASGDDAEAAAQAVAQSADNSAAIAQAAAQASGDDAQAAAQAGAVAEAARHLLESDVATVTPVGEQFVMTEALETEYVPETVVVAAPANGSTDPSITDSAEPFVINPVVVEPADSSATPVESPVNGSEPVAASVPSETSDSSIDTAATALFGVTWEKAAPCSQGPTKKTSVQDTMGRLWWSENDASCAYRGTNGKAIYYDGYVQAKYETAAICSHIPTVINSMPDTEGRLWGYDEKGDTNCKFITKDGNPVLKESIA